VGIAEHVLPNKDAICRRSFNCLVDLCVKLLLGSKASPTVKKNCFPLLPIGPAGPLCVPMVDASFNGGLIELRSIVITYEISSG
jgi:hypothetical protein